MVTSYTPRHDASKETSRIFETWLIKIVLLATHAFLIEYCWKKS